MCYFLRIGWVCKEKFTTALNYYCKYSWWVVLILLAGKSHRDTLAKHPIIWLTDKHKVVAPRCTWRIVVQSRLILYNRKNLPTTNYLQPSVSLPKHKRVSSTPKCLLPRLDHLLTSYKVTSRDCIAVGVQHWYSSYVQHSGRVQ